MNICIIPARGGSKRIPHKNIKEFCGVPMIGRAIRLALESTLFDRVIVSTDDNEIRDIAILNHAEVPFVRPSDISGDYASTASVIKHAVEFFDSQIQESDMICCLYPCTPFLTKDELRAGRELIERKECELSFCATKVTAPLSRIFSIEKTGAITLYDETKFLRRTQDICDYYYDAGQFYWARADYWLNKNIIFNESSRMVVLPRTRAVDIDNPDDWEFAENLFKVINS